MKTRLQKLLAQAGMASRRKAEELITLGKVKVNEKIVKQLGAQADPEVDSIVVAGKKLSFPKQHHYYAYHKPRGMIVSKSDELNRKTIFSELNLPANVNYAGRLDKDSEGLLLLSDDGKFIYQYTHPSFGVRKFYHVQLSQKLTREDKQKLMRGIPLREKTVKALKIKSLSINPSPPRGEGKQKLTPSPLGGEGKQKLAPSPLGGEGWGEGFPWIEIEICDGIKREIRRMMEFLGKKVERLIRIQHGNVKLGNLPPGQIKKISPPYVV